MKRKLIKENPILSIITLIILIYTVVSIYNRFIVGESVNYNKSVQIYPSKKYLTEDEAIYASQKFVESRLKSPKSAEFPPLFKANVKEENGIYTITSYVDAANSFNAIIRSNYTVKLKKNSNGGVSLVDIQIEQ